MRRTPRNVAFTRALWRHATVGVAAFVFGLWVTGCPKPPDGPRYEGAGADKPTYGGTFRFYVTANVRSLDPQIAFDTLSGTGIHLMFDGLLDYTNEAKLTPVLAASMPEVLEDGHTYRFRLRKGVHFHDSPVFPGGKGRELTADDVKWTLERLLDPKTQSPGAFFFTAIDGAGDRQQGKTKDVRGIKVVDRYTVDITLAELDQTFLNSMAMTFAYPLPHENYEAHPTDVSFHPVGTGPYVFDHWERGVRITLNKNKHYWQPGLPYIDRMVFDENLTPDVAAMRFRNGDYDHGHHFRQPDYIFFSQSDKWRPYMFSEPDVTIWGYFMNCEMPPFDNVHIRRAIAAAIDRERWARIYKGRYMPTGQILPPQLMGYDAKLPHAQKFDLDLAKEEMRLAGFPNGLPDPITVWTQEGESAKAQAELLQADLRKIGIPVDIKPVSFATYLTESGKRGRVPMALSGWNLDFPDPADFLDVLLNSSAIHDVASENRSFYSNPELDRILNAARVEPDEAKRTALYREANDITAHDAPWVFIYNPIEFQVRQPYLRNYTVHPVYKYNYRFVWLDLPRRRLAP
ncbi:MAG: ABC transporter substrate-binding protein [Polyangiales bacterium]